jgi:MFS transporter, putative metabolite:H+ symporter
VIVTGPSPSHRIGRISFGHPFVFWTGTLAVALGVFAHLPDFFGSAQMGYHMGSMPMSRLMLMGMLTIILGMCLTAYGLMPPRDESTHRQKASGLHFQAMDAAHLTPLHWGMMFVLGVALVIDVMKPATLGFVIPGMKGEYSLKGTQVAWLPLIALSGTTLGSLLWGALADRIGRRAAILLASVLFMGTSICGFMPSYGWNLFMCFVMGIAAGGMLPIVYALMAESIPARRRGWLVVLHGGLGAALGYLVAAGLAAWLEPQFTWRMLWFAGLPTGLVLLLLNYWIPESPRYLLEHGRVHDAEAVMRRYGIVLTRTVDVGADQPAIVADAATPRPTTWSLFRSPFLPHTVTVLAYGLSWGLVNWGFLTFLPTILRDRGLTAGAASRLLFLSAVVAVPGTVLVAYLYGLWSSKKSMILFAIVTVASLAAFAIVDPGAGGRNGALLMPLVVLLLLGSGGIISMLSPYTAEVYPTALRGTGSGIAAGSSKLGGIVAPPLAAWILAVAPGFTTIGVIVAVPVAVSALVLAFAGVETRGRGLEELTSARSVGGVQPQPSDA